jgi:ABC-2 type transport system ATP-binding protein
LILRNFLKNENRKNGVTMILTTHDMDDIEALCSRVMVIGHGKLLYDGKLDALKERYSPLRRIKATLSEATDEFVIDGIEKLKAEGNVWTVLFDPAKTAAHTMVAYLAQRLPLKDIVIEEQDIDEIIASMYREMSL